MIQGPHPKTAPGPRGWPILGNTRAFLKDPLLFLTRAARQYGDVVNFSLNFKNYFFLNDPQLIRDFFVRDYAKFDKTTMMVKIRQVIGSGLLTCPFADHKRQRRIVQPAFTASALAQYGKIMPGIIQRQVSEWKSGMSIDLTSEMDRLTLKIAASTLLGDDMVEFEHEMEDMIDRFHQQFTPSKMFWSTILPGKIFARVMGLGEIRVFFEKIAKRVIVNGLKSGFSEKNVLSQLAKAIAAEGGSTEKSEQDLTNQIINMLLAGQETVATTMNWMWYVLGRDQKLQRQFQEEIDRVFQGKTPSVDKLEELRVGEMIIKETLRLFPAGWVISRVAMENTEIRGIKIPRGSIVLVSPFVTQRDSRNFPNPLSFDIGNWTDEKVAARPEFSYFPFGGGARGCIGSAYAMMEMKLILAAIGQLWEMAAVKGQKVEFHPLITLRPKDHILMKLQARRPVPSFSGHSEKGTFFHSIPQPL